jgi:hypothetical protein
LYREDYDTSEEGSETNYWYTRGVTKQSWPVHVENEVVIRKKGEQRGMFGGEESRQDTLDHLIGVFKKNMKDYHLTE